MKINWSFRERSLKTRLISHYLVVLAIGGLATSVAGSRIVSSTILRQTQRLVDHDFTTARTVYEQELRLIETAVRLAASGTTIPQYLGSRGDGSLLRYLDAIRKQNGLDFLSLADPGGRVIVRATQPDRISDVVSLDVVRAALGGRVVAATSIVTSETLSREDPQFATRARMRLIATPRAKPLDRGEETSGMVLMAAAPAFGARGEIAGALYGGILLNGSSRIADRVYDLVYRGEGFSPRDAGTITIFQNAYRISTNVRTASGEPALGTRVSAEVEDAVFERGGTWRGRAFVVGDWYISRYEPIRACDGKVIGMLYVGLPEKVYAAVRDRVILLFFGIAGIGFILIIGITYREIGRITRPIGEMAAATRNIAAGRFDQKVRLGGEGEIADLAKSFNMMLESLRQMKADLEEWGRTLEDKVKQRTEELVAIEARVAQAERLASLGMLAAGVAHEINNPLGGILSLTALTLEDMTPDDPGRENLEEVVRQTERCRDIVKGLLEFSRQSRMTTETVDLNKLLLDTLSLITRQATFFNIEIVKRLDDDLPVVRGDGSQIQQVFMNILMNAAQAMEERGVLTITTRRATPAGLVEVLVSDTGRGIPPANLKQVFDPFFTTKESGHGTGLGLSIAYGIVTRHGGTISVDSEVGKATTFTIRLPAAG